MGHTADTAEEEEEEEEAERARAVCQHNAFTASELRHFVLRDLICFGRLSCNSRRPGQSIVSVF